jgi:hypothetical protein
VTWIYTAHSLQFEVLQRTLNYPKCMKEGVQPESFWKKNSEFGCEMKTSHRFDCAIGVVVGSREIFSV